MCVWVCVCVWASVWVEKWEKWEKRRRRFHLLSMRVFVRKTRKKLFGQQADARYCFAEKWKQWKGIAHLAKGSYFNSFPPIANWIFPTAYSAPNCNQLFSPFSQPRILCGWQLLMSCSFTLSQLIIKQNPLTCKQRLINSFICGYFLFRFSSSWCFLPVSHSGGVNYWP